MTSVEKTSEQPARTQADFYVLAERNLPGAGLGGYSLPEDARTSTTSAAPVPTSSGTPIRRWWKRCRSRPREDCTTSAP